MSCGLPCCHVGESCPPWGGGGVESPVGACTAPLSAHCACHCPSCDPQHRVPHRGPPLRAQNPRACHLTQQRDCVEWLRMLGWREHSGSVDGVTRAISRRQEVERRSRSRGTKSEDGDIEEEEGAADLRVQEVREGGRGEGVDSPGASGRTGPPGTPRPGAGVTHWWCVKPPSSR